MDPRTIARALAQIAEATSETLELQEVFDRVAASVRELIPIDHMGVMRMLDAERVVVHATTVRKDGCSGTPWEPLPLDAWSPRLRPRPEAISIVHDAHAELDPGYRLDAEILRKGTRSSMWQPFRTRDAFTGGVWLSADRTHAFTEEHQKVLPPIAALLSLAVEHWRIWDSERRRRERLDQLERPLRMLGETLDVREVFDALSAAMQPVLPHDLMALTEHDETARTFRLVAYTGETDAVPSEPVPMNELEAKNRFLDHEIIEDTNLQLQPETERNRVLLDTGMRSWLRVPIRLWGEVRGSIGFFHREPKQFSVDDVEVARRLADRVALAMSHASLATEQQLAASERERAERLAATVETLTRELESRRDVRVVGKSKSWREVLMQVGRVASAETTVLITGESGTGKEVVSRLIHEGSPRADRTFLAINCAALPDQLLESELFGHEKGAFTGAVSTKVGRLEQAQGGTLFLDEVGEMSPLVQAKLLRVLQEREFQRLGGTRTLRADVRLIAATNRDLATAISRGDLREDLYYRLAVFEIHTPPLRERADDILLLAEAFLEELGPTMPRPAAGISRDARDWLLAYPWPGNVRELRNAIERAILLCDGGLITHHHLPTAVAPGNGRTGTPLAPSNGGLPAGGVDLDDIERNYVQQALDQTRGNKSKAAKLLGLTRAQLYSRLEKYGLR